MYNRDNVSKREMGEIVSGRAREMCWVRRRGWRREMMRQEVKTERCTNEACGRSKKSKRMKKASGRGRWSWWKRYEPVWEKVEATRQREQNRRLIDKDKIRMKGCVWAKEAAWGQVGGKKLKSPPRSSRCDGPEYWEMPRDKRNARNVMPEERRRAEIVGAECPWRWKRTKSNQRQSTIEHMLSEAETKTSASLKPDLLGCIQRRLLQQIKRRARGRREGLQRTEAQQREDESSRLSGWRVALNQIKEWRTSASQRKA